MGDSFTFNYNIISKLFGHYFSNEWGIPKINDISGAYLSEINEGRYIFIDTNINSLWFLYEEGINRFPSFYYHNFNRFGPHCH